MNIEEQNAKGQEGRRVTSLNTLAPCGSEIADGRSKTSPDSEQIELSVAEQLWRNSASLEQFQDRGQGEGSKSLHKTLSRICKFAYCSLTNSTLSQRERVKQGFTLAEVLITLGIIGIVAAMTLPALVKNYRALVLQNQFKQAYAELNTASRNFYFHNDLISLSEFAVGNSSATVLKAFSKEFNNVLKSDGRRYDNVDEDGHKDAVPYTFYSMNGKDAYKSTICDTSGWFWDGKGRLIGMDDNPQSGYNGPKLCIDINGEKLPNKFGVDFFVFNFTVDGYVIPLGQEHKNNHYDKSLALNGVPRVSKDYCVYAVQSANHYESTCSNFALSNKHPHKEGKDYWHDFINGK